MSAVAVADAAPAREVLLIDLSSIFFPCWKASKEVSLDAINATLGGIGRCVSLVPGAHVAVCCDSRSSWRKEMTPTYKADREALPNAFYACLRDVKAEIVARGTVLWEAEGFEADDLLATARDAAIAAGHNVVIATGDKDMFQLLDQPQVRMLKTTDYTFCTAENVIERFGVAPAAFADMLALVGDKSDGVKGADGVGFKTAAAALAKWGSLDALYVALEGDPKACGATAKGDPLSTSLAMIRDYEQVMLARKLVSLRRDAPIKFADIYATKEAAVEEKTSPIEKDLEVALKRANGAGLFPSPPTDTQAAIGGPYAGQVLGASQSMGRPTMDPLTTSPEIDRIASALASAQGAIEGAKKDSDNPFFKSKYADLAAVWAACRMQLARVGIAVVQIPNGTGRRVPIKCWDKDDKPLPDGEGSEQRLTTLLVHASGQWIGGTFTMVAGEVTPQAAGSCITYMRRYSLAALVGVAPEDDDGNAASKPSNANFRR